MATDGEIKIKILQLVNGELYGGAERVQEMILKLINQDLFKPYCVSLMEGAFVREARRKGLPIKVIPMRSKLDLGVALRVAKFIEQHEIALVHTHTVRTNLVGRLAARIARVPVVTHVHSLPLYETTNPLKNRFNHLVDRLTRRWSARYICVSSSLRSRLLSEGVPAERVEVIHNGVELDRFCSDPHTDRIKARSELGLNSRTKLIAMIALFRPLKGTETLIEALARVIPECPDVYCLLVGGFEREAYRGRVMGLSRRLGLEDRVIFLGFRGDVSPILAATDLVVHPSLFGEGLPLAILEALAAGRPVITTPVGGIPEVIRDGETGLLVPPGDRRALAEAIVQLLQEPEQASKLGSNAQSLVKDRYSAEAMVRKIERIYLSLVDYYNYGYEQAHQS